MPADDAREVSRRDFLRGTGSALAAPAALTAGVVGASGIASASHMDEPGENITIEYDEATLETYRPRLVFPTEAREKLIGLYGWIVRSADYDTDVACYFCRYTHQQGWVGPDSHFGDTEPMQVEFDPDTGEVKRVRASIYHWIKGEVNPPPEALLYDETHAHLRVISPWHQYTAAGPSDDGTFVDVSDLTEAYPDWLANGLEDSIYQGAFTVPWRMQDRAHFWQDTLAGLSIDGAVVSTFQSLGLGESGTLEATA